MTVPGRLREVLGVEDGDYVRMAVIEVIKKKGERMRGVVGFHKV